MAHRHYMLLLLFSSLLAGLGIRGALAQDDQTNFRVQVEMVQLNVAVTDSKGNYISGLGPNDFEITEDEIAQKLAIFAEGNATTRTVREITEAEGSAAGIDGELRNRSRDKQDLGSVVSGANVFILFDTSNYMYRGFVYAQDAIADFVRSLDGPDSIAFYSYSRDLSRAATLTPDRSQVLRGVRSTVAGDDAALYNALLLVLKDASQVSGRKVIVVFSNGPDNASKVAPEDVAELAQSLAVPVYMISTREAKREPVSTAVFERMSAATGGKAYFAKTWTDQQKAFASIRDDLAHLYSLNYYPQANPNSGWRRIRVRLVGEHLNKYRIRTRSGYRPLPSRSATNLGSRLME
jgi:Ca-activated chloride channel homolog